MKLNTAVKTCPEQKRKLTSNKTKNWQSAGLPDDLATGAAKMSVLKHQGGGGVSENTALR